MSLLKILPSAVDSTSNYTFGNVSANYVTSNGIDLGAYVQAAFDKANTGVSTSTDQYARDTANTATTDISILQGVDTTQNTNITSVNQYAASSYAQANTNASNISIIDGVNVTQNTNITSVNQYAASAYAAANTNATNITYVNQFAQAAYDKANTGGASGIDQYARDTANTNTSDISILQGVNTTQNTNITYADSKAQAAFDKANSGIKTTTSATKPTSNNAGDLWYSTSDDTLYQYTYDGTSNNWVDISGPILIASNIVVQYTITSNVS